MSAELQITLSTILQQLANFFGTSVEAVTANAPMWLAKYGWYCVWKDIAFFMFFGILLGGFIIGVTIGFLNDILPDGTMPIIIIVIIEILVILFFAIGIPLIRCNMAPEFYGLTNLLRMLNA